ncbi:MAG: tyrosine-type recombinase/integrase [Polyangiaceae bacterium]
MKSTKPLAMPAQRDPEEALPDGFLLPKGFTCRRRRLADGSTSEKLLYRVEKQLRPLRKDGKPKLLSWSFSHTFGGLAQGLDKQRRIEPHLRAAHAEAARKRSKFYTPTLQEGTLDYLADPDVASMKSIADRRRHVRILAQHCGSMLVSTVTHVELREVMAAELARGQSQQSLVRLKAAMSAFFSWLLKHDKIDTVGIVKRVAVPTSARRDKRDRVLLTDAEQWQLFECLAVPLRHRLLYLLSRMVGGMRASDLRALTWSRIDTETWQWVDVARPKTDREDDEPQRISIEPEAGALLQQWFLAGGSPGPGKPVFARQRSGKTDPGAKGSRIEYSQSYARRLRQHLLVAGVNRPELHHDVPADKHGRGGSKRADFHSFRRLYCTGLAVANVNAQQARALAGHRSQATHDRYVKLAKTVMSAGAAARPKRAGE